MRNTYDGYFATELVLDLTSLDRARRVLLNELEEVLDTHFGCASHSAVCAESGQLELLGVKKSLGTGNSWRLVRVTIARTTSRRKRVQGLRAVTAALFDQSARAPHPTFYNKKKASSG